MLGNTGYLKHTESQIAGLTLSYILLTQQATRWGYIFNSASGQGRQWRDARNLLSPSTLSWKGVFFWFTVRNHLTNRLEIRLPLRTSVLGTVNYPF